MQNRFETFTVLMNRINRNIKKLKNNEMAEYDLRSAHVSCLYYIYSLEKATATDLCERCEEDKATVSRVLDYLETNGYIIREGESARRYKSLISMTEKGAEIGKKISQKIDDVLETVGKELTEEERLAFYNSLSKISESLEKAVNGK